MSENILSVSDQSFEADVLKSELPVLVDFWAEWCGPCRAVLPIVDEVAQEYSARLKVVKVNVDENSEIPANYGVRGIPMLALFKDGEMVDSNVGSLSKTQLTEFLDKHL